MPETIGLDFETYCAVDLPKHGLDRYMGDSTFRPLLASLYMKRGNTVLRQRLDFVHDYHGSKRQLEDAVANRIIVAHNAPFEQRTLQNLGIYAPSRTFVDSAVVARAAGAGSSLEAAAPQLLGIDKLESGKDLIKLFSIPGPLQEQHNTRSFMADIVLQHPDQWDLFGKYCDLDAELGYLIVQDYGRYLTIREGQYQTITMDMNQIGWCVDVPLVEEMNRRYLENQAEALASFRAGCNAQDLNLNSLKQLKEWCQARGVKATSFDEKHVAKLIGMIEKKLDSMTGLDAKADDYFEVLRLLRTKQTLGGSSLKKLVTILDLATPDDRNPGRYRLRDQYLHCGAGQTLRTTGKSVQMQNLKRLQTVANMEELYEVDTEWSNDKLAANLRQVFTATDPNGALIVGDFSSVESRGLAYIAGADKKLESYRQGLDLYKVLASDMFGTAYDTVTKQQRQAGKVGELSCGYGAGSGAVQSFAAGMGIEMSEAEAAKLVSDWRTVNPEVVDLWHQLDETLHRVVEGSVNPDSLILGHGLSLVMESVDAPVSLQKQHPGARSLIVEVYAPGGELWLRRFFHGVHERGRNVCYYRPSDRKTGDLWRNHFVDPKTKQVRFYEVYGGKLAGILTQSFCREMFFMVLRQVASWVDTYTNLQLVGQFHDEIVVDWKPGLLSLKGAKADLEQLMSDPGPIIGFPLAADIKHDYRYTK